MSSPLLDPARPPLIEVALTVQFDELPGLTAAHIGSLWSESYRRDFPRVEQHHPIRQVLELERAPTVQPRLFLETRPVSPRHWFLDEKGSALIQVQPDRISFNWRKQGEDYDYPRYESVRSRFEWGLEQLVAFVGREKLGEVVPNQCELLYANHVVYQPGDQLPLRHLGSLIAPWSETYKELAGAALEDVRIQARHVVRDAEGQFLGRILVDVEPMLLAQDGAPIYKVQLTDRGRPLASGISGALESLDRSHDRLRLAFQELLSDSVQEGWIRGS